MPSGIIPPSVGGVPRKPVEVVLSVGDVRQSVVAVDVVFATIDSVADDAVIGKNLQKRNLSFLAALTHPIHV